jgi:Cu-Zn family superoxide dismutase
MSRFMSESAVRRVVVGGSAAVGVALIGLALVSSVMATGATITRGELSSFAAGAGLDLSGHAQMVRTAGGKTIVSVHVEGLAPNTTYGSHVHQQACAVGDADGHYKFDLSGPAEPPNEIWPGFTTNAAGVGNGSVAVDGTAGSAAVSVVVHAPGGAKIACADLR